MDANFRDVRAEIAGLMVGLVGVIGAVLFSA